MENKVFSLENVKSYSWRKILSGTFLIAGTTIGAGMLGIPLATAQIGFLPALAVTVLVWAFMLCTGLLFLEVILAMPSGNNILSLSGRFLGSKGRLVSGGMFLFLYYCLMVAYFAAGAPLFASALNNLLGLGISGWSSFAVFALLFGGIVFLGAKVIDRANLLLTAAMVISYLLLVGGGSSEVQLEKLQHANWPALFVALPVLFSAFGYHNVLPSLSTYLQKDRKALRASIFLGTTIPLAVYLVWQWLVIGSVPQEAISATLSRGEPVTQALESVTGNPWIFLIGQYFAFFALVTSLLGVAFSLVDFLADGLKVSSSGKWRPFLTVAAFIPPMLCAGWDPTVFDRALGIAGGLGEAFLNGLLPVALVWISRYVHQNRAESELPYGKASLLALGAFSVFVMFLEAFLLLK